MFLFGGPKVNTISAADLQKRLEAGEKPLVIDCREAWEHAEGHIPGSLLKPLGQIRNWARELKKEQEMVVYCRTAARSASAVQYLQTQGFTNAWNMGGGIITWRGNIAR